MDSEELDSVTFSIHASAKEATLQMNRFPRLSNFQSTPPRRRRPHGGKWHEFNQFFNPRLREGGDKKRNDNSGIFASFQSTPPRRRRHITTDNFKSFTIFSIHASAKEATLSRSALPSEVSFQSTPPRRRRRLRLVSWGCEKFFNPRLREGGDP